MQVQPSNISHLLNGRNKPSIDFLIKLKETFPEYSFDWIILGKKPITLSNSEPISEKKESVHIEQDTENFNLFNQIQPESNVEKTNIVEQTHSISDLTAKEVVKIILIYSDKSFEMLRMGSTN